MVRWHRVTFRKGVKVKESTTPGQQESMGTGLGLAEDAQQVMANSARRLEGDSHHPSNITPAIAGAGPRTATYIRSSVISPTKYGSEISCGGCPSMPRELLGQG